MRILMLSRLYKPHVGGVERHVEAISLEILKKGHDITLITEKYNRDLKDEEILSDIKIIRVTYPKMIFLGLLTIWTTMYRYLYLLRKADIIHCHDVFIWYLPFKLLFPNKPVFTTFHGYESSPIKKRKQIVRKISELLSTGNICIGRFMKKWYKTQPNIVSYGAVRIEKFATSRSDKIQYNAVFSSRLDDQTGILTYIDTVRLLKKRGTDFKLIVLGNGIYRKKAAKVAKVKGFVNNPSIYFKKSKFAFVSRYLAILEAFAAKKLVFAVYDNPIKKDYLCLTPFSKWIIIESDPKILADKVQYYMNHPEKAQPMIDAAYEWVKDQTWEKLTDQYLQLWGLK